MDGPPCYHFWWSTTRCQNIHDGLRASFYGVTNLFIKPQNFLLMSLICKLKGLYLIATACDGLWMFFFHFVCKLLSNMNKQHISSVSPEVFCLWLLTWKYYLIHPLFTDVNIVFFRIFWPIYGCNRSGYTAHLILLGVLLFTTMILDNVCRFLLYSGALPTSLARVQDFSLMVTRRNFTALKTNGITEDIFIIFQTPSEVIFDL